MPLYYFCSVCKQKVERDLVKYIHHTEQHIIDAIKKKHPDWNCSDGLCPKCLECFHKAMRGEYKT